MIKQIAYFDLLRLISSVAVIMIHTVMDHRRNIDLGSNDWQIFNIIFASMHFAVPIFFMMSGALFLDPNREIKVSTLYRKNILRLLTAYFGWSLIYAIFYAVINNWPPDIVLQLFFTSHHHLWFLPYLIVLYLLTPAFRPIARDKDALLYFVIGACILTFVLFTFNEPKIWTLSLENLHLIIDIPLSTILTFICSLFLTYLIKKIPFVSKYLV